MGVWRTVGSPSWRAKSAAGTAGDGAAGLAAVRGEVFRFQREPLSREAPGATRHRPELYLGQAGLAGRGAGAQEEAARGAPPAAGAATAGGNAAAFGRQHARLVCRSPPLRLAGGAG